MNTYSINLGKWLDGYKAFERDMVIIETGEQVPNVPYLDNQHLKTFEFKKDVRQTYDGYSFHTTIDKCINSSLSKYYSKEYIYYKIQVKDVFEDIEFDSHSSHADSNSKWFHGPSWCKKMRIIRKLDGYEISESTIQNEYFCTKSRDKIRFFNKESDSTLEDVARQISNKMKEVVTLGSNFKESLERVDVEHSSVDNTNSVFLCEYDYVLDILKNPMRWWLNSFNDEVFVNKQGLSFIFKHYPNFDKDIFYEITGINVDAY